MAFLYVSYCLGSRDFLSWVVVCTSKSLLLQEESTICSTTLSFLTKNPHIAQQDESIPIVCPPRCVIVAFLQNDWVLIHISNVTRECCTKVLTA